MDFDKTIINYCAPVLCKIKSASLFSIKLDDYKRNCKKITSWINFFSAVGICFSVIYKQNKRILLFVYDKELLRKKCFEKQNAVYLKQKKFPLEKGVDAVLREMVYRLTNYSSFPHEIGVFLDYPLEDVVKFEKLEGTGSKYSGYWKVYGNVDAAQKQMEMYKACSKYCVKLVASGISVPLAAEKYIRNCNGGVK